MAIVLLVLLRMSIGWQFLYEGLWKIDSLSSAKPWSAEGYLKNAQGPFRNHFRELTGDPDDLAWLDYDTVSARWDEWTRRFEALHPDLDENQARRLKLLLDGPEQFVVRVTHPPADEAGLKKVLQRYSRVLTWDPERKVLVADGTLHLVPRERDALLALAPLPEDDSEPDEATAAWRKAVERLYTISSRLSFRERLAVLLKADPERVTLINDKYEGTVDYRRMGDIERYREDLQRYEQRLTDAETDFQRKHLDKQWADLQTLRLELAGPVKALEEEYTQAATGLLTTEQLARGPVHLPETKLSQINRLTIYALTGLGVLLIAGLCSRLAAIAGAGMLLSFYLVMPPWPGVPPAAGPEHSFIINKNLIEAIALLGLAALPTGTWFGLDAIFYRLCGGGRQLADRKRMMEAPDTTSTAAAPPAKSRQEPVAT